GENDRRAPATPRVGELPSIVRAERSRVAAAIVDTIAVLSAGLLAAALLPIGRMAAVGVCALLYHAGSLIVLGSSPSVWMLDTYAANRHPSAGSRRFLRLVRTSVRVKV